LLKNGTLKTYKDLPHGCHATHPELINADILNFIRGDTVAPPVDAIIVEPIPA
jgi:non-heme chloroperoxidase